MSLEKQIQTYRQRCFANYTASIDLPDDYRYPDGNPIRPLPPIQTSVGGLMIIGAYPSARFESRKSPTSGKSRLIPIADNLQPFGTEEYFDGIRIRRLESGAGLRKYLLTPLGLSLNDCWVTDLVKVFLFKPEHINSCKDVSPEFTVVMLRKEFMKLGKLSLSWIQEECDLCKPKIIVTLGYEVAKVVSGLSISPDGLLIPKPYHPESLGGHKTFFCPHPDACRRFKKWHERMTKIVHVIKRELDG